MILERLARFGPMSLVKLGRDKRWKMKLRLYGTKKTLGLIPNNFVHEFKVSKERVNYDLTAKGLLAILAITKFEKVDMVIRYEKFLREKIEKEDLLNWSLEFIKYEIALILYYNYDQGLNWTKFKNIKPYWTDYKTYSNHTRKTFFMHEFFESVTEDYKMIESRYLTLFSILDYCTATMQWGTYADYDLNQFAGNESFRIYVDRWYIFIDERNLREHDLNELLIERVTHHKNDMLDIDESFKSKIGKYKKKAREILQREGYDIDYSLHDYLT
jgi:hypothetical protein